jgi:hypothetical protein
MNTRFAKRVFLVAAIYGIVAVFPQYFMEAKLGIDFPPPLNHPEHFYGFLGIALAWQFAFLLIAKDVVRYRLFMLPAAFEKLSFGVAVLVLYAQGRVVALAAGAAVIDLVFALFFLLVQNYWCKPFSSGSSIDVLITLTGWPFKRLEISTA